MQKSYIKHMVCAVLAVMSRSTISRGNATPMIVSLRIITNAETTSTPINNLLPLSRASGCAVPVGACVS